jgi:autotransporter-associated beta strand protein
MDLKTTVQSLLKRLDRPAPDRHVRFRALVRRVVRRQLRIHLLLFLDQCRSIATRWQAMNLPGWPLDGRFRLAIGGMSRASFYLERLEPRLHFTWIGATSGNANNAAHDYDNLLNWLGGIIDNNFSTVTLSSNTTIYVAASTPTLGGFNLGYAGNYDLTFESSSSTAQTLTLNGGITGDFGGSANDRTVTFGSAANPLNLNLNGGSRTLNVNAGDTLLLQNVLANGTLIKTGSGTLTLAGANTYAGGTTLSAGTLDINNAAALGTGTLTIDGGTTIDNTSGSAITLSDNNAQNWNGNFTFAGTDDLNLGTGAVTMGASRTVTIANGNLAVGGDIAGGSNTLSVSGSGRLIALRCQHTRQRQHRRFDRRNVDRPRRIRQRPGLGHRGHQRRQHRRNAGTERRDHDFQPDQLLGALGRRNRDRKRQRRQHALRSHYAPHRRELLSDPV